jgi:hypothetical protein
MKIFQRVKNIGPEFMMSHQMKDEMGAACNTWRRQELIQIVVRILKGGDHCKTQKWKGGY